MTLPTHVAQNLTPNTIGNIAIKQCRGKGRLLTYVKSDSQQLLYVHIRAMVARKAKAKGYTLRSIGEYLNRHHSTISHYLNHYQS